MDDEKYYQAVADELREGRINDGLWTKALARCQGDENKTKATYIQWRVEQIMLAEKRTSYGNTDSADESEETDSASSTPVNPAMTILKWLAIIALSGVIIWAIKVLLWPKLRTYL